MAKANYKGILQKLLTNELSSADNDKKQVMSAYKSLIDILKVPQIDKQLHGCHELLFACLSQIILTQFHQYFDDNQLRLLLESASNARVLSMSQNQTLDDWLQNVEERDFEKPDFDENEQEDDDDDDDDLYEDATDSEEDIEVEIEEVKTKLGPYPDDKHKKQVSFQVASRPILSKEKSSIAKQSSPNQRNVKNLPSHDNQVPPFDPQLPECYKCGERGHIRHDCPKKKQQSKLSVSEVAQGGNSNNKKSKKQLQSSSNTPKEVPATESDQTRFQQVYNQSSKLLNSSQNTDERNQTFELFLSSIDNLKKQHSENLAKIFADKETIFYPLFCHIAQNSFLFTDEQYSKLYQIRTIILPKKQHILNEDRSLFSSQRTLMPLKDIRDHAQKFPQIQPSYFNDLQQYVIRATPPVSTVLYNFIKFLLKSSVHIDGKSLEYFTKTILFDLKKDIFSNEQIEELQSALTVRTKRSQRNQQKNIWKERLNQFQNEQLTVDLNQWIDEFNETIKSNDNEPNATPTNVTTVVAVDHAMWYFAVLTMSSSAHLNNEQYERLLNAAIQSTLFNSVQRFYFQVYLKQGHAPITNPELNTIKKNLENDKQKAYQQINNILDRQKPEFNRDEINRSPPEVIDLTQTNNQSKNPEDIIPFIDTHILSRLVSLVETICSDIKTFSLQQCTDLVNKFLYKSSIVRPISQSDQQRLSTLLSRSVSLSQSDLIDKKIDNKTCENTRLNQINRKILNQYLTDILSHNYQAHLDFFNLLENISQSMNFDESSIEFEINRCLLSTIILIITEIDFSNAANIDFFRHRLQKLIDKQTNFFLSLLTEHQFALIVSRLTETKISNVDLLINTLKSDLNKKNFLNLIEFIQNDIKEKDELEKLINFILYTFDEQFLSIKQTIQLINVISTHPKLTNKTFQNLLQFLLDLLQLNIHSSPKVYLKLIETNQDNQQTYEQILSILKLENANSAIGDWKKTMIQLLTILFQRENHDEQLKTIAQQSSMFKMNIFKQQLETVLVDNPQQTIDRKTTDSNEQQSANHRTLFHNLESNDTSMNEIAVRQLQTYLVNELLPSEILTQKFIQALQIIFKNPDKFSQFSLDQWWMLIEQNRGKIFNDLQCDQLLLNIMVNRIDAPNLTLNSLQNLIVSRKAHERHDGLHLLLRLLRMTPMNNEKTQRIHLPTLENQFYNIVIEVVFNERFKNEQVRQCLTAAKHSTLLNTEHRATLDQI